MNELATVIGAAASKPARNSVPAVSASPNPLPAAAFVPAPAASPTRPAVATGNASLVVTAVAAYSLLATLVYYDTVASMVTIWLRSQTFAHGFLILPISLWLAWRLRNRFASLRVQPELRALFLVLAAGLAWLLARLVDVQVVQHLAFVAVLVSGIWAIVGTEVARCYAFPLGFLFLGVPMGAGLIPPLMELTADTTEILLRASGIPVYREGMYLHLPTGTWSVIEECSGVRYLIASFTLGLFYAHLAYHSLRRRAAFMVAAIIVPIVANTVRAYGVVMVGHLSDMRFGVGADHLIYGWVLFGLAMLLMFWVGGFWQQPALRLPGVPDAARSRLEKPTLSLLLGASLAVLCASSWPALALSMNRHAGPVSAVALTLPDAMGSWKTIEVGDWRWAPAQPGADRELDQLYAASATAAPVTIGVHIRQYLQQQQGAELVTNTDPWRPDRKTWRVIGQSRPLVNLDRPITVDEAEVVSGNYKLLVWSWYRIDGRTTANAYMAKFLETKQRIVDGRRQGARIFVATPLGADSMQARQVLQDFVTVSHGAIGAALDESGDERTMSASGVVE